MGKLEMHSNFQLENEKDHLKDGSIILKGILKEYVVTGWTGFLWHKTRQKNLRAA
jgi:hypothetical protein